MGFWEFLWLMVWAMFFVLYLMVIFQIILDIFRDGSLGGWAKAGWLVALFVVPVLTALIYVIARGKGMNERELAEATAAREATENYIRTVAAPDAASQISNAKQLLDSGAINQAEFDQLKTKALAGV